MKKTLRTMMLAAAGVLGSVAVAHAQQPPPPAPPAPPGQPGQPPAPPPADFGVAPAALPAAPVANAPVPTVTFGNQPAPDSATPAPQPAKKQNPFFFTRFNWTNTASTQIFGVGQDYQGGDSQQYTMDFQLNVRYAFIADSVKRFYANVGFGWGAELTNSDSTTKRNEWQLRDMSVGLGYQHRVYKNADGTIATLPVVSANMVLPTSPLSRGQGKYLATSLNAALVQTLPIVPKSDWLSDIYLVGGVGWTHLFARSYTPTNEVVGVQQPRQGPDGAVIPNDQLVMSSFAMDNARLDLAYYITIYKDLSFNNSWEILLPFKHQFPATDVTNIATGPVHVGASNVVLNPITTFDIGLSYSLFNMARIDLGYQNITAQLNDNRGKRRSVFYGPDAAFYTNVSVYIDSILDKAFDLTGGPTARRAAKAAQRRGAF